MLQAWPAVLTILVRIGAVKGIGTNTADAELFERRVGERATQPLVRLQHEAVVTPQQQVVEVDPQQQAGGVVVVLALVGQLELGQLWCQVLQLLPGLAWGAGPFEVVRGPPHQRIAGEQGLDGVPVGRLSGWQAAEGVLAVHRCR